MTLDQRALLTDLQRQVRLLEEDVRQRAAEDPAVDQRLRDEHAGARRVGRTATAFDDWRGSQVTQAAVAWVLATVLVRFCEDNGLVDERWIAGPGERMREATERQQHYLVTHGDRNDRDWLRAGFEHLAGFTPMTPLFDADHNPLFRLEISADAASDLLAFWRRSDDEGAIVHDLTDPDLSTRFLGDLYQDLSEAARKQYALLQTPDFVEELILDLTLDPAIDTFGLAGLKMIDPTCGSGHFLLGAFDRLLEHWAREAPSKPLRDRIAAALGSIHGVDVNPFASAIARLRLTVAAMRAEGVTRLAEAVGHQINVGTGDSLLHGKVDDDLFDSGLAAHTYASEDLDQHPEILRRGRYQVVVGNPPYITVKDKALNAAYREGYETPSGKYALSVPFAELFFTLAVSEADRPGYVGQITSNSFMKREFGKKLVEEFLPRQDLTHVIDTSGAYIPGHGTPTVILVGRRRLPRSTSLRAALGIRGEPSAPADPAQGLVWRSLVHHLAEPGYENDFVSISDLERERLATHPWSLSGGGADVLKLHIQSSAPSRLGTRAIDIGIMSVTGEDDLYLVGTSTDARRARLAHVRPLVEGDVVRDFTIGQFDVALWPYGSDLEVLEPDQLGRVGQVLSQYRTAISHRKRFGTPMVDRGLAWWEWQELYRSKMEQALSITFAFVATHNHFVLDRGGKVFNRSAPVIKLPEGATEDDHLALLGVLNSSTACFWLKQVCHNKGSTVDQRGARQATIDWENFYEFTGTKLQEFPLAAGLDAGRARQIEVCLERAEEFSPVSVVREGAMTAKRFDEASTVFRDRIGYAIANQEELDWEVYRAYGLVDEQTLEPSALPPVQLGERAFEIVLARKAARGEADTVWFERHRSTPITQVPAHWSDDYRRLVERRIELIESDPQLRLLERPDCKRRWADEPWETKVERALRDWLLDRLEEPTLWRSGGFPATQSVAQLAGRLAGDTAFLDALEMWAGRTITDPANELARLLADEHVPYLAAHRYKASGLRTRTAWEETWDLQRREDAGEVVDVPVPPKYKPTDFARTSYWRHRGKLDVPKERFISYLGAERGADTSLVLGWAGWDHAEQSQALAVVLDDRQRREGWEAPRLVPLLAGLAELEPWLHQWHAERDPRTGRSPADEVTGLLEQKLGQLHLTREALAAWRPPAPTRGRRPRS